MNQVCRKYYCLLLFVTIFIIIEFISCIYIKAQIYNSKFDDSRIIVTLSNAESRKLRNYTTYDFPELNLSKVEDLTYTSREQFLNREKSNFVDGASINKFNQTLCLYLKEHSLDNVKESIKILSKRNEIIAVSPDYYTENYSVYPNDPYISNQWALDSIDLYDAWGITTGLHFVTVGVIDSGIQGNHPDLSSNIDTILSADCRHDPIIVENSPTAYYNHGTCVAGVIGAKANNSIGVAGSSWNAKLVSLKVLDGDDSYDSAAVSSVIRAIDYATVHNIDILNYSSGFVFNEYEDENLANPLKVIIANYPGLFVCAAGNHGMDYLYNKVFPAYYHLPNMIVVGACNQNNNKCNFSDYSSTKVDLFAPGYNIYTTDTTNTYSYNSGTSFSAPYVSGVAALIKTIRPDFSYKEIKNSILNNIDHYNQLDGYCITGGKLNAYKAVRSATEQQTFLSDVNGDGYNDMILSGKNSNNKRKITTILGSSNGNFTTINSFESTRNFFYQDLAYPGDFNGDGRCDLVVMWNNGGYRQLLIYLGNSNGSFDEGVNLSSTRYHDSYAFPYKVKVIDVNRDGKDDFVVSYKRNDGKRGFLVYRGSASSPYLIDATTNALDSNYDYFDDSNIYSGDFNGDGRGDIIVPTYNENYKRVLIVYRGRITGRIAEGTELTSVRNHLPETFPFQYLVGDIDGDNRDDFIDVFIDNGIRNSLTYKGYNYNPYITDSVYDSMLSYENEHSNEDRFVGDVNGDGLSDLIIHYSNSNDKRTFDVFKGNSNGQFEASITTTTSNTHDLYVYPTSLYISDINNDNKIDFIVKWKNGNNCKIYVYKGNSNYKFSSCLSTSTSIEYYSG